MKTIQQCTARSSTSAAGFTYLELLVSSSVLMVSFLALAGMFVAGSAQITGAGNMTMGLSATRQILEDARRLPFDDLIKLDGFDTEDPTTLPASGPELEVARRWRYALAGDGVGWAFTSAEQERWPTLANKHSLSQSQSGSLSDFTGKPLGASLGASGRINAAAISATVTQITVTVAVPGRWRPLQIATRIASP